MLRTSIFPDVVGHGIGAGAMAIAKVIKISSHGYASFLLVLAVKAGSVEVRNSLFLRFERLFLETIREVLEVELISGRTGRVGLVIVFQRI